MMSASIAAVNSATAARPVSMFNGTVVGRCGAFAEVRLKRNAAERHFGYWSNGRANLSGTLNAHAVPRSFLQAGLDGHCGHHYVRRSRSD
jgi:hypothetical protein